MFSPTKRVGALAKYLIIMLGASILSFGLYNLHERTGVTEGGVLGAVLLLQHWFHLSPAITNPLFDLLCYLLAFKFLGKAFAKYAVVASLSFALSHGIWERFPPLLPDLTDFPLAAAILGALFVGLGVGLVVRVGGACGGDDALALSLSYIPLERIAYSLVTVTLSSFFIGRIQVLGLRPAEREPLPDNA